MVETRTVVAISAASAAALAGYLLYFDYKRRNDPDFRKKLRKEKKKAAKSAKPDDASDAIPVGRSQDELKSLLAQVNAEELPTAPGEREKYFMEQVGIGEQLLARGPAFEVAAALTFYKALRAYPSPVEIIMIFQNTLPPHIFTIVMELASLDVSSSESALAHESAPDAAPTLVATDPLPETAPVTELEAESEVEPSLHESEVVVEAEVESEVEVEVEAKTEAEVETDAKGVAEVEPETEATIEVEVLAEPGAELGPAAAEVVEALLEAVDQPPTEASAEPIDPASVPLDSDSDSEGDAHSGVEVNSETDSHYEITSQDGHHSEPEWDHLSNTGASQAELPPQQQESN